MKISKNVGELDSLIRISMGLSILGYGIAKKSGLPILLGSWKVAEGITGFSIMYHLFGINTLNNEFNYPDGRNLNCVLKVSVYRKQMTWTWYKLVI